MSKVIEVAKALYANVTIYRLIWTAITVFSGMVAAEWSNDPRIGLLVAAITQVVTSEARERLGEGDE